MGLSSHLPISAHVAPCWCTRNLFFFCLMHPIGPGLPISAHVACAHVCRQMYVLRASQALVQATVGVGTVIIVYIGIAYTRGKGGVVHKRLGTRPPPLSYYVRVPAPQRFACLGQYHRKPPSDAGDDRPLPAGPPSRWRLRGRSTLLFDGFAPWHLENSPRRGRGGGGGGTEAFLQTGGGGRSFGR